MKILSIETSCDETACAVVNNRQVISNVIYSQITIHKKWGGVVPHLAKRAHEEKIDFVVEEALKKNPLNTIDAVAVTYGPGLAAALEVGIKKAVEIALENNKKLVAVNHLEGHLYSPFVQNSCGRPETVFQFPYLGLIVSGGHTEFVVFRNHLDYRSIGATLDDAAGEAIDKAAKLLGLGYPGGPVIERISRSVKNSDKFVFPRPMAKSPDLNFSFSGLKTSFFYFLRKNPEAAINDLAFLSSSFQEAVFDTIRIKTEKAVKKTGINRLILAGGVSANLRLRRILRKMLKKYEGQLIVPSYPYLTGDNAAMIAVAAFYKAKANMFFSNPNLLDRVPRLGFPK